MSPTSLIQYSTLDGSEKFYMEATDFNSPLCLDELSRCKCPCCRLFNLPKTCADLGPYSESVGVKRQLLGDVRQDQGKL